MTSDREPPAERPSPSSTFHTFSATPDKLGKYSLLGEIGRGSMGTVYAANDPFSSRRVAIKVAHQHFINSNEDGERFKKTFFNQDPRFQHRHGEPPGYQEV